MKTFVTGATGLVGSYLIVELLKNNHSITALCRKSSDFNLLKKILSYYFLAEEKVFEKIQWVEGDITDFFELEGFLDQDTYVFHCAAMVSFKKEDSREIFLTNVEGTKSLLTACLSKNIKKLVFVSSIAALGRGLNNKPTTEEDYWTSSKKTSIYSRSKFEAESEVWRAIAEGLNAVIINPAVVLAPGDWNKSSAQLIKTVWNGLKFYTEGSNAYIDARDVAKAMVILSESNISNQRYILANESIAYKNFFYQIAQQLGVKPPAFKAGKILSELAWISLKLLSIFNGKSPLITKETARMANKTYRYSSEKIKKDLEIDFIETRESIAFACEKFLLEHNRIR